jgi:peptide/nickel transport system permease protein
MLRYIARRSLWGIVLLFIVSAVTWVIFFVFPTADPIAIRAGRQASPEQIEALRQAYGLDGSPFEQFVAYMQTLLQVPPDLGMSYESDAPVLETILDRLPATIFLTSGAVVVWLAIGLPTGIIAAIRQRSLLDRATMITTLAFFSAPVFWLGLVALYLFSQDVGLIPIFPGIASYQEADGLLEKAFALILPWFVLAAISAAIYARYLRSSMIEVMSEDYIRTARAKGVSERGVVFRHGVRSAITPVVTLLGLDIGILLAGNAILTETVFNIQGVGRLVYDSIQNADLPMIQGTVLFGAFFIIVFNLLVDIAYAFLDPRVRY